MVDGAYGEEHASECIPYYEAAYELGSSTAASQLAILYEFGKFVEQDLELALQYYDKAIQYGNGNGSERIDKARVYEKLGRYDQAKQCYHETLLYYDNEIENGKPEDACWCWEQKGDIYKLLNDQKSAKDCYEKALLCGNNAGAATSLGVIYEDGIPGFLNIDLEKALYYYKLGYDTRYDDARAVFNIIMLARFYFHDKAGEGMDFEAFRLCNEARNWGSNRGNIYLGFYYGTGIPGQLSVNTDLALQLLDAVPAEDEVIALYYKGVICLATLHDEQTARVYLEVAAQKGSEDAKSLLLKIQNRY